MSESGCEEHNDSFRHYLASKQGWAPPERTSPASSLPGLPGLGERGAGGPRGGEPLAGRRESREDRQAAQQILNKTLNETLRGAQRSGQTPARLLHVVCSVSRCCCIPP